MFLNDIICKGCDQKNEKQIKPGKVLLFNLKGCGSQMNNVPIFLFNIVNLSSNRVSILANEKFGCY